MKRIISLAALASILWIPTASAADVGVSVTIGQPGFYGQIDIGDFPHPRLIYSEPRHIESTHFEHAPIYLRVPGNESKNWRKYCHKYKACGQRVYFVEDSWYEREYVPRYRNKGNGHNGNGHNKGNGHNGNGHNKD